MSWPKGQIEQLLKEHAGQAVHNEEFLSHIKATLGKEFFDWRITVIFYICVHCVDAKLAQLSIKIVKGHVERNMYVAGKLFDISTDYFWLYNESISARYEPDYRTNFLNEERVKESERILGVIKAIVPSPTSPIP